MSVITADPRQDQDRAQPQRQPQETDRRSGVDRRAKREGGRRSGSDRRTEARVKCSCPALVEVSKLVDWLRHPLEAKPPRRPLAILRAAHAVLKTVPTLSVVVSTAVTGERIADYLHQRRWGMRRRLYAKSVLFVPPAGRSPFSGKAMQAVRTNMRRAAEAGFWCAEAPEFELLPEQRTFRMFDAAGEVAGTIGITVDESWAMIDYLVSDVPEGFYLLHGHVVEAMQEAGVEHLLINAENAPLLRPGLLYMQGRMGYEVVNLRLAD